MNKEQIIKILKEAIEKLEDKHKELDNYENRDPSKVKGID